MPKKKLPSDSLPQHVIKEWPEIFSDIDISYIPLRYVNNISITFDNGRTVLVDVNKNNDKVDEQTIEKSLRKFLKTYDNQIIDIDFSINAKKVKKDAESFTASFLHKKQ